MTASVLEARRQRAIYLIFAMDGVVMGTLYSRLAELQLDLGLNEAELGVALTGVSIGFLIGNMFVSRVIERYGIRPALYMMPAFAGGPILATYAGGVSTLFVALVIFGFGMAAYNVAMNVEADRIEAAHGNRIMNRCHAMWAVGFLLATALGTGASVLAIEPRWHFIAIFVVACFEMLVIVRPMEPAGVREGAGETRRHPFVWPSAAVLLIMGFALSGAWLEVATRNWSIIFVRDEYSPPEWIATLALPAIVIFQIIGRLMADRWIERFGHVLVARTLIAVALAGLLVVVLAHSIPVTLIGFGLIGLGISTAYPQAYSVAAQLGDRPASENVASVAMIQPLIGLVSPPIIGLIATDFGNRISFMFLLPIPVIAFYFARYLANRE